MDHSERSCRLLTSRHRSHNVHTIRADGPEGTKYDIYAEVEKG